MQTVLLWPNIDAGSDHISKAIRVFRDRQGAGLAAHAHQPQSRNITLKVLGNAACAVGNSSSFVRDAGYFGTPVVLVGDRQEGREVDVHVIEATPAAGALVEAIRRQVAHGRYAPSTLYGDGDVSARIADGLARLEPYVQKRLHYIYDKGAGGRYQWKCAYWES